MSTYKQSKSDTGYEKLLSSLKTGEAERFYIFFGEERYLLERTLMKLRTVICPDGLDGFNYRRFDGKGLSADEIEDAVDTLPLFAEKTLVEIHDFDIFKNENKEFLSGILSDLPDYVCLLFVYNTVEYKPDARQKINKDILKHASVIEFVVQEQDKLIKWIKRHFTDAGKNISTSDAEYLAFITGGLMANLNGEIEKTAAYSKLDTITRADIDAVVTPVLDTVAYKLTDALVARENKRALLVLDELFQMREAPHKMMYSVSLKMRQLLAARVSIESNQTKTAFMEVCGIRHEFQARTLLGTAGRTTLTRCRNAVLCCAEAALELNSSTEPEARMTELVTKLAFI